MIRREPLTLADGATLTSAANIVLLDSAKMTPPSNRPMLVRDISIVVRRVGSTDSQAENPAISLKVKIDAGRFSVTQGFVPAWLLGPVHDRRIDFQRNAFSLTGTGLAQAQLTARLRWILPKPMYLPPNTPLRVTLQLDPLFTQTRAITLIAGLSAHGLLLDKAQATTDVPYVSAFVPAVGQLQSGQQELCNVLDKPIQLHRMIGRIGWWTSIIGGTSPALNGVKPGEMDAVASRGDDGTGDPTLAVARKFGVRLRGANGAALTSGATSEYLPFWSIFPPGSNAWMLQRVLEPNEQIVATLSTAPTSVQRPMISLVGHRTERI